YEAHHKRMPTEPLVSVVVPCFNEEANLRELVARLDATFALHHLPAEILLVDDASRDGTWGVIQSLQGALSAFAEVRGLRHETNRGIVGGWKSGAEAARAPHLVITDADLQYAPEDIPRLYAILLREDVDVVQGWRIAHDFKATYRYVLSLGF